MISHRTAPALLDVTSRANLARWLCRRDRHLFQPLSSPPTGGMPRVQFVPEVSIGAPSSRTRDREWLRPVPITSAPARRASCTAVDPTAPPAPWMITV
jgi:hypothetical protein